MGWTNSHLYEIRARDVGWNTPLPDIDGAGDFLDARTHKNNRNGCGCSLRRARRKAAGTASEEHRHSALDQIIRQSRQVIILVLRPAIFDRNILTIEIAGFAQTPTERINEVRDGVGRRAMQKPPPPALPAAECAPSAATPLPRRR
jgi:hypothetical protein